jgi:hypothetical protein
MLQNSITWDVIETPVYANNTKCAGYKAITRSDNGSLLNIAKKSYTPTSNGRLVEVAEKLSEITGFSLEGFDTFNSGRKVLGYLKNNREVKVCDFPMHDYMVIGNSHDYSTGFFIGTSTIMLRCENQFSKINRQMKVQHTRNHNTRIDELIRYFENYIAERNKLFCKMEDFSKVQIDEQIINGLINRLLLMDSKEEVSTRKANIRKEVEQSIIRECSDIGNNLLGLFNGITHYTTHIKKSKEKVFGNVLGTLATTNEKAFQFCESLL